MKTTLTGPIIKLAVMATSNVRGTLGLPGTSMACALGRGGVTWRKREGDGATPAGTHPVRRIFYRPDRISPPITELQIYPIAPNLGWCDDPAHAAYNSLIRLPFAASHEQLWRQDHRYDVVIELGYNDRPAIPRRGSAIFLHIAAENYAPTEGCIAVSSADMPHLLAHLKPGSRIIV